MSRSKDEFLHFLASRRSIRRYQPRAVDESLLQLVVEAARWAPSAHNRQPWRLMVITDKAQKRRLAQEMADRLRRERLAKGDEPQEIELDAKRSIDRLIQAAALVVVFLAVETVPAPSDERGRSLEHVMAVQSAAMAGQNMLLMAHQLGLGACWICAPLFADVETTQVLDCPSDWEPQGLIMLGWPDQTPPARERIPLDEVTWWI